MRSSLSIPSEPSLCTIQRSGFHMYASVPQTSGSVWIPSMFSMTIGLGGMMYSLPLPFNGKDAEPVVRGTVLTGPYIRIVSNYITLVQTRVFAFHNEPLLRGPS